MRSQDAVITRVLSMPTVVNLFKEVESALPKLIVRNRQLFEVIFTLLQIHPCYLQNMICKTALFEEPEDIKQMLLIVFGARSILDNTRVIVTM